MRHSTTLHHFVFFIPACFLLRLSFVHSDLLGYPSCSHPCTSHQQYIVMSSSASIGTRLPGMILAVMSAHVRSGHLLLDLDSSWPSPPTPALVSQTRDEETCAPAHIESAIDGDACFYPRSAASDGLSIYYISHLALTPQTDRARELVVHIGGQ